MATEHSQPLKVYENEQPSGVAEGMQDWYDHLKNPQPDNYWFYQNFEYIRL